MNLSAEPDEALATCARRDARLGRPGRDRSQPVPVCARRPAARSHAVRRVRGDRPGGAARRLLRRGARADRHAGRDARNDVAGPPVRADRLRRLQRLSRRRRCRTRGARRDRRAAGRELPSAVPLRRHRGRRRDQCDQPVAASGAAAAARTERRGRRRGAARSGRDLRGEPRDAARPRRGGLGGACATTVAPPPCASSSPARPPG